MRRKVSASEIEKSFGAIGEEAHECVVSAIKTALRYQTFDAAYVETLIHQERRKQSLPSPTVVQPKRKELNDLELDAPDLSRYDRFTKDQDE